MVRALRLLPDMNTTTCQSVPQALVALGWLIAMSPAPVWACSISEPPPTLFGQPAHDDKAVPTNVVLHYAVPSGTLRFDDPPDLVPGKYALRSAGGVEIALRVTRSVASQLEIVPTQPLEPNTAYTLTAQWQLADGTEPEGVLTFETGAGPLDEAPPPPPTAVIRSYQLQDDYSAECGPHRTGTCISAQDDERLLEYTWLDQNENANASSLRRGSAMLMDITGISRDAKRGCIELRYFGASGVRSQPLRLCGADAPVSDLTDLTLMPDVHCSAVGLTWCDATGKSGTEPGPEDPRGADGAAYCPPTAQTAATSSALNAAGSPASAQAGSAAAAPAGSAAGSCSAAPGRAAPPAALLSLFALLLASTGLLRRRRSR